MKYSPYAVTALLLAGTALLAVKATAQDSDMNADEAVKTVAPVNGDMSVDVKKVTTTTTQSDGESATVTKDETTVSKIAHPPLAQGAAPVNTLTAENFPPQTDEASKLVYVSGGVGDAEIAYFKSIKEGYTLKLLMADKTGHLVDDVTVAIADAKGANIATLKDVGPYLAIKLPTGKYKVTATLDDASVVRNVTVADGKIIGVDVRF